LKIFPSSEEREVKEKEERRRKEGRNKGRKESIIEK
jgi:hypothetical protein